MKVFYRVEALADLNGIISYIASENPAAATQVGAVIRRSAAMLEHFPHAGRIGAVSGTYELVVPQLPYINVYRVHSIVEIVSVFHAATDTPRA